MDSDRFALLLLLNLRAVGHREVDSRAFHAAFADLVEKSDLRALLDASPVPHPLFDVYPCVEAAYDEALRCGIASWLAPGFRTLVFELGEHGAEKLLRGSGMLSDVAQSFAALYDARRR